jgi:hypothetical protein
VAAAARHQNRHTDQQGGSGNDSSTYQDRLELIAEAPRHALPAFPRPANAQRELGLAPLDFTLGSFHVLRTAHFIHNFT